MTLLLAMLLDAVFGEPKAIWSRVPHPVVVMGRLISQAEKALNRGGHRREKGVATLVLLLAAAIGLGVVVKSLPGQILDVILLAVLIAQRSLSDHVGAVALAMPKGIEAARSAVAQIVGRDSNEMTPSDVARSAIESGAENLSDGVVAPIFWFCIGGLPGVLAYKITNTADSMIGYRTDRYREFGWAAARFDDALNFIPARLTALLIVISTRSFGNISPILNEAPLHRSPNAGWPEAAMAHGLNIALSGPRRYEGELKRYPFVNATGKKDLVREDIDRSVTVLWKCWAIVVFATLGFVALR